MAVTRQQKEAILEGLTEEFKTAGAAVFHSFIGMTVSQSEALRRSLREQGVRMIVAKKTLIQLAAKNAGLPEIPAESLTDAVAVSFAHEDELAAAQSVFKFGKDNDKVQLLGGLMDGAMVSKAEINQLATLPSRDQLLGQLVSVLIGPVRGMAGVGHGIISGFVRALSEVEKKKAAEAA